MSGKQKDTLREALALAKRGIPVFPCKQDKSPATPNGFKNATTNQTTITRWFAGTDYLIGVPTGKASGLCVLDIDDLSRLDQLPGAINGTLKYRTRRGMHIVFAYRPGIRNKTNAWKIPGVDIRGEGGYVIWWPAHGMELIEDTEPHPAPDWMVNGPTTATVTPLPAKPAPKNVVPLTWPATRRQVVADLAKLDPDADYESWVRVGMAIYHESGGSQEGYDLFHGWSARGSKYVPAEWPQKWHKLARDGEDRLTWSSVRNAPARATEAPEGDDEPLIDLCVVGDHLDEPEVPVDWIMQGRLPLSPGVTILAGKPKHGKSWMALGLAIAAATGDEYLGTKPTRPMQSIYVAADDPGRNRFLRRCRAYKPIARLDGLVLATNIRSHRGSSIDLLDKVIVSNPNVKLVVIDTLSAFREKQRGDNPYQEEYNEVKALNDWATRRGICVLLVHHLRKGEVDPDNPFESISGTLGLQGACDGMMVLSRRDLKSGFDSSLDEKLAGLWYRGRDLDDDVDIGAKLHDGRWHLQGSSADVFHAGTAREIIRVLARDPSRWMTGKEIHAEGDFDCKVDSVRRAATRLARQGKIESHHGARDQQSFGGFRALQKR